MAEFVKVATIDEIPDGRGHRVRACGRWIGLFRLGGEICAIDDTCTHAEASLCDGDLHGDEVICPLHFATFNVRTGACTGGPAYEDVVSHEVRINGRDVEVLVEQEGSS